MKVNILNRPRLNLLVIGLLLVSLIAGLPARPAAAENEPQWQDLNINVASSTISTDYSCIDPLQPGKLLTTVNSKGPTYSIDLATGQKTTLNSTGFSYCNEATGLLYNSTGDSADPAGIVFSSADPAGKLIAHKPEYYAQDGSLWVYTSNRDAQEKSHFYASPDGGLTWQERNISGFTGQIAYITVTASDGRVVYLLTQTTNPGRHYYLYVTKDGGVSWEKTYEEHYDTNAGIFTPALQFDWPLARSAGANFVSLTRREGSGSNGTVMLLVSDDWGKTWQVVGSMGRDGFYQYVYSDNSLVRFRNAGYFYNLSNSTDGGKTWKGLEMPLPQEPFNPSVGLAEVNFFQMKNAPDNLFMSYHDTNKGDLWHSADGGKTWRKLGPNMPKLIFSPYAPSFVLAFKDDKVYRLDLAAADKTQTNGVAASNASDGAYFEATRHNLSGVFKKYWNDHGGLAQFGFAWTEPFRELNPADGKIYIVQYFERNRFEYHPEFAGTPYEVLLGLLGNQQTETYRANKHGAFNYFADAHYPGGSYYPQTGHNLRNSFKDYWEANGGLAIYGYPISEEFEEVNPDDGKTYVVQYFERNRFEYHPENKGTKYEVLLGLLGNSLLKSKGWL